MKQYFLALMMSVMAAGAAADNVLLYSPGEKDGMRIALERDGSFVDMGQAFSSDYGPWGAEKRMHSPAVYDLGDDGYVALFSVNDHAPCFAVAYSDDLANWRPQDYPVMGIKGCLAPRLTKENGRYTVCFKSADGRCYKTTTDSQFRHFSRPESCEPKDYEKIAPQTATRQVGNDQRTGYLLSIGGDKANKLYQTLKQWRDAEARWRNGMTDDGNYSPQATLTITPTAEKRISDKLIGVFFEDISYAADGGLYAEMVQNRDFEYSAADRREWSATTAWKSAEPLVVKSDNPLSEQNPNYLVLRSTPVSNEGWDGFAIEKGKKYDFSVFARCIEGKKKSISVRLKQDGNTVAEGKLTVKGSGWKRYSLTLTAKGSCSKGELEIASAEATAAAIDIVSLFPQDTFKGHKNGLRRDLAVAVADLHPKFVRFPGGCMSHGQGISNIYRWKETVGPLEQRVPAKNVWNYHQTRGLGFYEYFLFCEDIGAEPLPVLAAGVPCQNSWENADGLAGQQGGIPMSQMQEYIDELCDLIEWANADPATNEWAKMRADAGHPKPFNLKYIGIGNEDLISTTFEERYIMICEAIKQRHPEITICGTVGPFHYPSSDYVEGWRLANDHRDCIDMVDEHYYETVGWYLDNQHYYDNYDRKAAKVYLGEWASKGDRADNALVEAYHLCGIERNADIVEMTSYAPLFARHGHFNWRPDLIYFDNEKLNLSPCYETQRMFGTYCGDRYIASTLKGDPIVEQRTGVSVVRNSKTGHRYIRLVNTLSRPLDITVNGLSLGSNAKMELFTGNPGDKSVKKQTQTVSGNKITLPAYSCSFVIL